MISIPSIIFFSLVFILGTVIGSFLNVVIWRLPRDQKLTGRSKCPNCHHQLIWLDLIPVLSFLFFGAKCRYCSKNISWRYPLIEILVGILFILAVVLVGSIDILNIGNSWIKIVEYWFIFSTLIVVFITDLEHYLILDKIIYPATIVVLVLNFLGYVVFKIDPTSNYFLVLGNSIVGMIAGFLPFYLLWKFSKGRWMGLGDAKFGLFLGAILGFPQILLSYFIAFLLGTVVAIPLLATGKKELSSKLPFGTFLAVSALITLWFGPALMAWYFGLIGLN